MSCQTNTFYDWTFQSTITDIEETRVFPTSSNIRQSINTLKMPYDLKYDDNHVIIMDIIYNEYLSGKIINNDNLKQRLDELRKLMKLKVNLKNRHLNYYYDKGIKEGKYNNDSKLHSILKTSLGRESSGVMVYSIFTNAFPKIKKQNIINNSDGSISIEEYDEYVFENKHFSCKYDCHYCPNEEGQPRSYIREEPGVARATENDHDPIRQFIARSKQYISQGHPIDKCEVIIQGGTWDSYPIEYRTQFIRDIYYAANNLDKLFEFEILYNQTNLSSTNLNNDIMISEFRKIVKPLDLEIEIQNNVNANVRIIGLTPETRPDQITPDNIKYLRQIGATRLQLGIQHINDKILRYVNRGCYFKHTVDAIKLLKDCGFKVDGHWMPDLPRPVNVDDSFNMIDEDIKMFDAINNDPRLKLDQIKIYPCMVTPTAKIQEWYNEGKYQPYGEKIDKPSNYNKLTDIEKIEHRLTNPLYKNIYEFLQNIHPSVRINRIIRDIPGTIVTGGTREGGMRSQIEMDLDKMGIKCRCIRCRECQNTLNRKVINPINEVKLNILPFCSSDGIEFFISFESNNISDDYRDKKIHSFLRLRLTNNAGKYTNNKGITEVIFPELVDTALIRELHTYGQVLNISEQNNNNNTSSQHQGYGKRLMKVAECIAHMYGFKRIAVIAGVGVRQYYYKLGYADEGIGCYQIKHLDDEYHSNDISTEQIEYINRLCKYDISIITDELINELKMVADIQEPINIGLFGFLKQSINRLIGWKTS